MHYADGERQEEVLAIERVRLLVHAGEELPLASGSSLAVTLGALQRLLQGGGAELEPARKRQLQQRLTELTAYAKERYSHEELQMRRSITVASHNCLAPTATATTTATASPPGRSAGGGSSGGGGSGGAGGAAIQRALELAAQLPAIIKINSTRPPQGGRHAWTLVVSLPALGAVAPWGGTQQVFNWRCCHCAKQAAGGMTPCLTVCSSLS